MVAGLATQGVDSRADLENAAAEVAMVSEDTITAEILAVEIPTTTGQTIGIEATKGEEVGKDMGVAKSHRDLVTGLAIGQTTDTTCGMRSSPNVPEVEIATILVKNFWAGRTTAMPPDREKSCYKCGKEGHISWDCREKVRRGEVTSQRTDDRRMESLEQAYLAMTKEMFDNAGANAKPNDGPSGTKRSFGGFGFYGPGRVVTDDEGIADTTLDRLRAMDEVRRNLESEVDRRQTQRQQPDLNEIMRQMRQLTLEVENRAQEGSNQITRKLTNSFSSHSEQEIGATTKLFRDAVAGLVSKAKTFLSPSSSNPDSPSRPSPLSPSSPMSPDTQSMPNILPSPTEYVTAAEDFNDMLVYNDMTVEVVRTMTDEDFDNLLDTHGPAMDEGTLDRVFDARHGKWPKEKKESANRSKSASPQSEYVYEPKTSFKKANLSKISMRYGKEKREFKYFSCGEAFESGNQLHDHLVKKNHFSKGKGKQGGKLTGPKLIESTTTAPSAEIPGAVPELTSNYNYMHVPISYTPDGERTHSAVFDTGFGYSAVDRTFLEKVIQPTANAIKIENLPWKYVMNGFGGDVGRFTKSAFLTLFIPDCSGKKLAVIRRRFMVNGDLKCNILIGTNIMELEEIDISPADSCLYLKRHGNMKAPAFCHKRPLQTDIPVRTQKIISLKKKEMMKLSLRLIGLVDIKTDYIFTPNRVLSNVGILVPESLVTGVEPAVWIHNPEGGDVHLSKGTVIGTISLVSDPRMNLWAEASIDMQGYFGGIGALAAKEAATMAASPPDPNRYTDENGDVSFNYYGTQWSPDNLAQSQPLATSTTPDDTAGKATYDVSADLAEAMKTTSASDELRVQLGRMELEDRYHKIMEEKRAERNRSPRLKVVQRWWKSIMTSGGADTESPAKKKVSFQPRKKVSMIERYDEEDRNYPTMPPENSYVVGKAFAAQQETMAAEVPTAKTVTKPPAAPDERPEMSRMKPESAPTPNEPDPVMNDKKWRWLDEEYVPTYKYPAPPGIKLPSTPSTYEKVDINKDVSLTKWMMLKKSMKRHKVLFNDEKRSPRNSSSKRRRGGQAP
ncbi:hypothetical protein TWF481_002983 [Arthrobotrys musiformis]|uniref:CCHC-type domain-containing protein n=1 Tax=Arthrobotrys musiformis TaxID=47236 RepID=A0AAV9VS05_9PEZI